MTTPISRSAPDSPNDPSGDATQQIDDVNVPQAGVPPNSPVDSSTLAEATLVQPSELAEATVVDPMTSQDATQVEFDSTAPREACTQETRLAEDYPESAVPTVVDAVSQPTDPTFAEMPATAGSSSAARAWAPTKGASEHGRPGTTPTTASAPRSKPVPRAEDRYRLIDNFAHGGLGNIWRAEDLAIHREVAFKELLPKALKNRVIVERFLEEAQITGQLEHPGIVPIYDVGFQENGTPFYAMKLVKGRNLETAIEAMHALPRDSSERQLAFTRLLRQFIAVCQAVGFAHEKGVLHRDLKPLNVMLGEFGETLVLDWGLAKLVDVMGEQAIATDSGGKLDEAEPHRSLDSGTIAENATAEASSRTDGVTAATRAGATVSGGATAASSSAVSSARTEPGSFLKRQVATDFRTAGSQTIMGQIMGTPAYMPPEQARGLIDQLDARTDIYSLGAILYKLLTNQQPVPRGKTQDVLAKVIAGEITRPRQVDPNIPPALEAICLKAMALRQADRYARALDLAADIEAWLADEPVSVYPDRWHTQLRRWYKRHRMLVHSTGVAAAVLLAVGGAWLGMESNRINGLRLAAHSKIRAAQAATEQADFHKANSLLAEALGQVQAEAKLVELRNYIQNDLDNVARLQAAAERERIAELRTKAARLLDDARQATDTAKDFAQARTLLTEAVTLLAKESALADLHRDAETRLAEVNQSLARQSEVEAAKALLAKFTATVEQVRVHGSNLSGEDSRDDLREALQLGLAGLDLFNLDFEQPEKLDERLTLLGPKAIESWKDGVFELLFTVAQAEINLAIKDQPDAVRAAAQLSLERLRNAERLGRTSPAVASLKADLLDRLGQTEAAQAALKQMAETPARTRFDHFFLGELARLRHDYDAAIAHYQDALQVDPDDYWSLNMIGYCHLYSQRVAAAITAYTACIARRPDLFWPYVVRGYALGELQQSAQAMRDFDKALELAPESYHVYLNRGVVWLKQKNYDAARADFLKAAELRPDLSAPHENLAELSRLRGRELALSDAPDGVVRAAAEFQTALTELTKALSLSPQQATLYHTRGMIRVALADPAAALDDFQHALRLETNPLRRAASFREIGFLHQRAKRLPEALAAFDQSLSQNPRDTNVIRQRAEVLLALQRYEAAIAGFTKFLELEGPVGDVYRARGLAFAKLEKYREAINDYTMSLQYEPSANMLTRRGWAYLLEASKLAREDFEEALRLNPDDPDSHQGLAHALVSLGDHAAGVAELEKVTKAARRAAQQLGPRAWPLFFNAATTYAQAYGKTLIDAKLTEERREGLSTKYITRAIEFLTEAHRVAGPQFRPAFSKSLNSDIALDPIRTRPEFVEFLKTIDADTPPKP